MRFIRRLLICLTLAIALAAILLVVAFTPVAQTWIFERTLARYPNLQVSVGSVSAGLSSVRITDLRLQYDGAVLTLPALEARLPVKVALWNRKVLFETLVAKGWTLDLTRKPPLKQDARGTIFTEAMGGARQTNPEAPEAAPVREVGRVFRGLLTGWELPWDATFDGVDLEGDILVAQSSKKDPARVHVNLKGGGMSAANRGEFVLEATGLLTDSRTQKDTITIHGQLAIAMKSPRALNRIEFKGSLSFAGGSRSDDLSLSVDGAVADSMNAERFDVDLSQGSRHLATITAKFPEETRRLAGTWKIDLQDSDLARFFPGRSRPTIATVGEGRFDADTAFARVDTTGRLKTVVSHFGVVASSLGRLGALTLDTEFNAAHAGQSLQVDRLSISVVGTRPIAVAQSIQPFRVDEKTGEVKVENASADWIKGSLQGLPIASLSGPANGFVLAGGDVVGDFAVKSAHGELGVRSTGPFVATGVSLRNGNRILGQGLDLSLALLAEHTPEGWQLHGAPLTVGHAGRSLATIDVKVSPRAEASRPFEITGTWNANLEAFETQPSIPGISAVQGRSASGNFSANVGTSVSLTAKISVVGQDAGQSLNASVRAGVNAQGEVSFHAPVTVAFGSKPSELTIDGRWFKDKAGPRLDAVISGVNVVLDHLGRLGASFLPPSETNVPTQDAGTHSPLISAGGRDDQPFWRDWLGHVKFDFYRLQTGTDELTKVAGAFAIDYGSIRLEHGQGVLTEPSPAPLDQSSGQSKTEPPPNLVTLEGTISFDTAAEFPYSIKAAESVERVDAARLLNAPAGGHPLVLEGRFSVAGTVTGNGANWEDLVSRRREEMRLTSKGGIIRLLNTNVAESIPETPTPVSDALANVSTVVGSLFGFKGGFPSSGTKSLSKETEAVLNFAYRIPEIRYDQFTVTAIREADRTIHLAEIVLSAPNERLTGSGTITYVKEQPLRAQPLSLELQFGASGQVAELLVTAGLLSSDKDAQGYSMMHQAIHFGGTLEQIDNTEWHDLLVKAATHPSPRGKKGG